MRKTKYTKKRIEQILGKITKKLNCNLVFLVEKGNKENFEDPEAFNTLFLCITPSGRGREDPSAFIVYYNEENLSELTLAQLKSKLFHECLHALSYPLYWQIENLLEYVKNKPLQEELAKQSHHISEDITYKFERSFGPYIFPELKNMKDT